MDSIIFIIFVAFIIGMVLIVRKACNLSKKQKEDMKKYSASNFGLLKHIEGLPVASGVNVEVFYGKRKVVFRKDQKEISIITSRIIDIDCVAGKELKNQAATGAIAGKFVFGGLGGAVIGSLLATSTYLIITYSQDGKDNTYIVLDTAMSGTFAYKVTKDFKSKFKNQAQSIEL